MAQKFLVISSMKDEGPYLLEWLAHHRAVGFTDFLIFTNDCTDGTDHMLDRLEALGLLQHVRTKVLRRGPQKSAFKQALTAEKYLSADWVYVTDADEFLCINKGKGKVGDLLKAYPKADVIPVTWRHFSTAGAVRLPYKLVCQSSLDGEPSQAAPNEAGRFVKSLFKRSDAVEAFGLHAPKFSKKEEGNIQWGSAEWLEDPNSSPTRPKSSFGYDVAQVNHYPLKSVDAYLLKRRRGRANHFNETLGTDYWDRWQRGGESNTDIARYAAAVAKEMAALLKDPLTAHLHTAAKALNREALSGYLQEPEVGALRAALIVKTEQTFKPRRRKTATVSKAEKAKQRPKPKANNNQVLKEDKKAKRAANRRKMLSKMPANGRCAEIGVWNGDFSAEILAVAKPKELTLIDPWGLLAEGPSEDWNHKKHGNSSEMDTMFNHVRDRFAENNSVKIRKGFSGEVLEDFPDDYFDWVYIDGNHQYEFVKSDLEMCFRKVRKDGVIAGDDFFWKRDGRMHVRDAVVDVLKERKIDSKSTLSRIGQQFMISVEKA